MDLHRDLICSLNVFFLRMRLIRIERCNKGFIPIEVVDASVLICSDGVFRFEELCLLFEFEQRAS